MQKLAAATIVIDNHSLKSTWKFYQVQIIKQIKIGDNMMLAQFQSLYPNGGIISELIQIFQGKYIVRVSLQVEGVTRATGLAGADTVEVAEDQARNRALMVLEVGNTEAKAEFTPKAPINTANIPHESMPVSSRREVLPQPVIEQNSNISNPDNGQVLTPSFAETATKKEEPEISTPQLEMVSSPEPEPQVLPEIPTNHPSNVTPFTPRSYSPPEENGSYSGVGTGTRKRKNEPVNLSDVIAQTDVQIERLGWTKEQGRDHLKKTYGKLGRSLLSEEELLDFLNYLKSQPDPIAGF